jgi:hypothetical protein
MFKISCGMAIRQKTAVDFFPQSLRFRGLIGICHSLRSLAARSDSSVNLFPRRSDSRILLPGLQALVDEPLLFFRQFQLLRNRSNAVPDVLN